MAAFRCRTAVAAAGLLLLAVAAPVRADTDTLNTIRNDVRDAPPSSTPPSSNSKSSSGGCDDDSPLGDLQGGLYTSSSTSAAYIGTGW
jgi:hypothetical protein